MEEVKNTKKDQIISEHFREMARKSHAVIKKKFGKDFYKVIGSKGGKAASKSRKVIHHKKSAEDLSS